MYTLQSRRPGIRPGALRQPGKFGPRPLAFFGRARLRASVARLPTRKRSLALAVRIKTTPDALTRAGVGGVSQGWATMSQVHTAEISSAQANGEWDVAESE